MNRIFFLVLMLHSFSSLSHTSELSVEVLIRGVNQERLAIQSGEIYSKTIEESPAEKTEAEITEWMKSEKEKELKDFTPHHAFPDVDVKEYEKNYLIPYLTFKAKSFREQRKIEHTATLFQVWDLDATSQKLHQYKLTMVEYPGYPIDEMPHRFIPSDMLYLLADDMNTQVKQSIGNIQFASSSTRFFGSNIHYGFWKFSWFGRSHYVVPSDAKHIGKEVIDDVECYGLAFIAPNGRKIHIWVDSAKDFCIRRVDYHKSKNAKTLYAHRTYRKFKKINDIWFPQIAVDTSYHTDGSLRSRFTVEVIAVELNVDFPKDFFNINKEYYKPSESEWRPGHGESPATDSENLLLLCGPESLSRICKLLKVETNLSELKKLSMFSPNRGTTMLGLKKAATYKGLSPIGVKAPLEMLKRTKVPLPAIAYISSDHFLVFESVNAVGVKVTDSVGKYGPHLTWDELSDIWNGDLLIFDKKKARRTKPQQAPLAFSEKPQYDFGKALGGSEIKHTFTIKNIGQKPLKILSVEETCVCTASILSQSEILPGKTGSISAILTLPSENRQLHERILVLTNDRIQSTLALTFKGESFTPIKTLPKLITVGTQKTLQNSLTKRISLHVQEDTRVYLINRNLIKLSFNLI